MKKSKKLKTALCFFILLNIVNTVVSQSKRNAITYQELPVFFPIPNKHFKRVSSAYGVRMHPIKRKKQFHCGIDLVANLGTPVYAVGAGTVEISKKSSGYGNHIRIEHKGSYSSLYGHLHRSVVKKGGKVKQGQVIGYVGSTGLSTGPHLHFEIRRFNKAIDPIVFWKKYLKKYGGKKRKINKNNKSPNKRANKNTTNNWTAALLK